MGTIQSSNTIAGAYGQRRFAGVPSNGVSEVQTLTVGGTPSGGSFKLSFAGQTSAAIAWSSTNATLVANVQNALRGLANIGTGGVNVATGVITAGVGTLTITFAGDLAKLAVPTLTVSENSLTGTAPTLAVAETTPGVTATHRGAPKGVILVDTESGLVYSNTGSAVAPVWTAV